MPSVASVKPRLILSRGVNESSTPYSYGDTDEQVPDPPKESQDEIVTQRVIALAMVVECPSVHSSPRTRVR
jgi:hypothetical protein